MAIIKTEALVLKTFDFRETSLIAHFFTKDYGRINGILKGIRKDPSKFASTLEPFSSNEIVFYQSRNSDLQLVSQCDLKDNFSSLRNNLDSIACAYYLVDLLRQLMPEEEKNTAVYELAVSALTQMKLSNDPQKVSRVFIIKFLKLIGFRPRLDACVICNKDVFGEAYFNAKRGGLLCPQCSVSDNYSAAVLKGTVASILHMEENNWENSLRLGLSGKIKQELNTILQNFMEFHLQVRPRSKEVLAAIS